MLIETSVMDALQSNVSMALCRSSRMYGLLKGGAWEGLLARQLIFQ